jgi:hypothetical protein
MDKIFRITIEIIFWVATLLSFTFILGAIGIILFLNAFISKNIFIFILIIGLILGAVLAETIRRKYGSSNYWGRILSTSDIWPNSTDENSKEKF